MAVRGVLFCLLLIAATGFGCRPPHRLEAEIPEAPGAEKEAQADALSAAQIAALEAIAAAGGVIRRDDAGWPTRIDLGSDRVFADEQIVRAVLKFPGLKGLRLAVSSVSEETLAGLATLAQLDELMLQDAAIGDHGLAKLLSAMPDLRRLTLRRLNRISEASFEVVAACDRLEVLALVEMPCVTGAGLERLARMTHLRSLDLRNCGNLAPDDFQCLIALKGLEDLKLGGPMVGDGIVETLIELPALESLTIEDAEISGVFLRNLSENRGVAARIESLALARCYGATDEALEAIAGFPNLQTLALRGIMITGEFLESLHRAGAGPLPLTTLIATNAFLIDPSLGHLPEIAPRLQRLDLRGNPGITDQSRPIFEKLVHLRELQLDGTGTTTEANSVPEG